MNLSEYPSDDLRVWLCTGPHGWRYIYYVRCWLYTVLSRFHDLGELHRMIRRQLTRIFILVVHAQPLNKINFL